MISQLGLLAIKSRIEEPLLWKGGLVPSLNKRLYVIRRLKNHIGSKALNRVAESIWTSKSKYALQLCTEVRLNQFDTM